MTYVKDKMDEKTIDIAKLDGCNAKEIAICI